MSNEDTREITGPEARRGAGLAQDHPRTDSGVAPQPVDETKTITPAALDAKLREALAMLEGAQFITLHEKVKTRDAIEATRRVVAGAMLAEVPR